MGDIGLKDINGGGFKKRLDIPAVVKSLPKSDRRGGMLGKLLDAFKVFREKGFFNKKWLIGLKSFCKLFRHGLVDPAVEVEAYVETEGFDRFEAVDGILEYRRGVEPAQIRGGVHLDDFKALGNSGLAIWGIGILEFG